MKAGLWTAGGSVLSAAASSACCWLPLVLVATGFSAAGAAAFFERFRFLFLAAALILLVLGFFLNYRPRRANCGPDGSCPTPGRRLLRFNRLMLWVSAPLVVAFALFPQYAAGLLGAGGATEASAETRRLVLDIRGMTCAGCEASVEAALASVPGVLAVSASYEESRALVDVATDPMPARAALAAAVGNAGYELAGMDSARLASPAGQWVAEVPVDDGNTRVVVDLGTLGSRWVGEFDVPEFGVEDYPVEVSWNGGPVKLHFTAVDYDFEGMISEDGRSMSGTGRREDEELPILFRRVAEAPRFSEQFLELEAAADDSLRVATLSSDGAELRERFNADTGKTRLLMLLSPT